MGWAECVAHRDSSDAYRAFMGKPPNKRPRGRPWRTWEDIIKMDLIDESE
jgi:hypothetical protein